MLALIFTITFPAEALVKAGTASAYFFEGRMSNEAYAKIREDNVDDEDTFREVDVLRRTISMANLSTIKGNISGTQPVK